MIGIIVSIMISLIVLFAILYYILFCEPPRWSGKDAAKKARR